MEHLVHDMEQLVHLKEAVEQAKKLVDEPDDVHLLRAVKQAAKKDGVNNIHERKRLVKLMLHHNQPPKGAADADAAEKQAAARKTASLKAAQTGALIEARQLAAHHPSLLAARSTTKGYTAMHYAAMAGALPVLDWLAQQGLSPDVMSAPADGSEPHGRV